MIPLFRPGFGMTTIPMVVRDLVDLAKARKWSKKKLLAEIEHAWVFEKDTKEKAPRKAKDSLAKPYEKP